MVRDLPTGEVSLLFTDIEGSTRLLARLGPAYVEALDGQRRVLRKAWAAHGGTELGTEGDSFFVMFPSAEAAVSAAAQAQRELETHPWPAGERLRVRIGIHTGSPMVYDGEYVGMDVHRAARIAGSAHGGQVVMSEVTADLARPHLPAGVGLRDLGRHRLKDIAVAEHLFQAIIDGLETDFAPLKALGAASSLPAPATLLVGRDDDLSELTGLLRAAETRLVTLTGPGGAGKTRLAIAVAQSLIEAFPDGAFFVPLASVTSAEAIWTSLAEVLDIPLRGRFPAALLDHVARHSALFVLDNLEQLRGVDDVVTQLLAAAPRVVVIATSRRRLSVPGEQLYPVPSLSLPEVATLTAARDSGAVQMFVQQARMVRPDFRLTADNVADVDAICRRLDGLPLGIELCAARLRLLSPKALLRRLHDALDIAASGHQGPSRQRTLRDTIAWSHELLGPAQQVFFRRLAVFAGGADLEAVGAVVAGPDGGGDALDMLADLADASLITIAEALDGEPRVSMLETIHSYARDQLRAGGEADSFHLAHARYYLAVAEQARSLRESRHLRARSVVEMELDNLREALGWALGQTPSDPSEPDRAHIGLRLCSALGWFWLVGGYLAEGRLWYERAIMAVDQSPSGELADALGGFANLLIYQGEPVRARDLATASLTMSRTLGDQERAAFAWGVLGTAEQESGDVEAAQRSLGEALTVHREIGDRGAEARTLGNLAGVAEALGDYHRAEALTRESLSIIEDLGDMHEAAIQRQNLAFLLAISGRVEQANAEAQALVETVLKLRSLNLTIAFANTYMNILIRRGDAVAAGRLFGAEEALRERVAMPNPHHDEELSEALDLVRGVMSVEEWEHERQAGRAHTVEELLSAAAGRAV
jgi:predicted ATPase/class 3 adenylate cyclase